MLRVKIGSRVIFAAVTITALLNGCNSQVDVSDSAVSNPAQPLDSRDNDGPSQLTEDTPSPSLAVDALYGAAVEAALAEKFDQSLLLLDKAIGLSPGKADLADLYLTRGTVYRKRGNYVEAIADCTKAIELNSTLADAYCQRAFAYQQSEIDGALEHTFKDSNRAIELGLNSSLSFLLRGNSYTWRGDYQLAIADFTEALSRNPQSYSAYAARARAHAMAGHLAEAKFDYRQSIALNPDSRDLPDILEIQEMIDELEASSK